MQRRAQEVINCCINLDENNPIVSIHDIGAGGLSNGIPELVNDSMRGAHLQLRNIPNDEKKIVSIGDMVQRISGKICTCH